MIKPAVRRVLASVGFATVALGPFGATPAAASSATVASSLFCGAAVPARLATYAANMSSAARTDVDREPASNEVAGEVPDSSKGKGGPKFRVTIDVYIHVVSNGAVGNVSDTAINSQVNVLNDGFSGREGGVDTGFRFKLAGVDRTDNAAWYLAGPGSPDERAMKTTLHRETRATSTST